MSPDKRKRTKKAAGKRPARKLQAVKSDESGPPYIVRWHPEAASERGTAWPPREKVAMQHAVDKLEAVGSRLMHPHSSAVQGTAGRGFRELRPRALRFRASGPRLGQRVSDWPCLHQLRIRPRVRRERLGAPRPLTTFTRRRRAARVPRRSRTAAPLRSGRRPARRTPRGAALLRATRSGRALGRTCERGRGARGQRYTGRHCVRPFISGAQRRLPGLYGPRFAARPR